MLGYVLPILFVGLGVAVLAGVFFRRYLRAHRERLTRLIPAFGGSVTLRGWFTPCWSGSLDGLPVSVSVVSEQEDRAPCLHVALEESSPLSMWIMRESRLTSWAKRLGLREVLTHDPLFDREFLILSARPSHAAICLRDQTMQRLVRELFAWGAHMVRLDQRGALVSKPKIADADFDPEALHRIVSRLKALQTYSRQSNSPIMAP